MLIRETTPPCTSPSLKSDYRFAIYIISNTEKTTEIIDYTDNNDTYAKKYL